MPFSYFSVNKNISFNISLFLSELESKQLWDPHYRLITCVVSNKRERIPKGQSKTNNPEKLATRRRKTKQKHNRICVVHHYPQRNTNNVNKTWTLLLTTGGKDEPNTFSFFAEIVTSQHGTHNVKKHNRTTQKTKHLCDKYR